MQKEDIFDIQEKSGIFRIKIERLLTGVSSSTVISNEREHCVI